MKIKIVFSIIFALMIIAALTAFSLTFEKEDGNGESIQGQMPQIASNLPPLVEISKGVFAYQKTGKAGTGQVMGQATDPRRDEPVVNIDINLFLADGTPVDVVQTDASGNFTFINLAYDDFHLVVDDPAYRKLDLYFTVDSDTLVQLPPAWLVPEDVVYHGDIGGKVLDVLTGEDLNLVNLEFRHGIDPPDTDPVVYTTQTSGWLGNFNYTATGLESGVYTAFASKTGFADGTFHVYVLGAETVTPQNGFLSPVIYGDEMRIILTWGYFPADLDSHIWAPDPFGNFKVHLFFSLIGSHPWGMWFDLDLDDILHYGPETTTIHQWESETYCFHVQDYTNRSSYSDAMSNSGARVAVLTATETTFFYITPNTFSTEWFVFTIDGATRQITPVNTYSFQADPNLVGQICQSL